MQVRIYAAFAEQLKQDSEQEPEEGVPLHLAVAASAYMRGLASWYAWLDEYVPLEVTEGVPGAMAAREAGLRLAQDARLRALVALLLSQHQAGAAWRALPAPVTQGLNDDPGALAIIGLITVDPGAARLFTAVLPRLEQVAGKFPPPEPPPELVELNAWMARQGKGAAGPSAAPGGTIEPPPTHNPSPATAPPQSAPEDDLDQYLIEGTSGD